MNYGSFIISFKFNMLSPPLLLPESLFLGLACMMGLRVGLPSGDKVGVKVGLNVYRGE